MMMAATGHNARRNRNVLCMALYELGEEPEYLILLFDMG